MASQYPRAEDLNLVARLKLVGTLHMRGFSARRIARELDYGASQAAKDVAMVIDRYRDFEDLDEHLRDVQARAGEKITELSEMSATLWKQLDYAQEWVVKTDGFGAPVYEFNEDGSRKADPLMGPRNPGVIPGLIGQLAAIQKQSSELLGLLDRNVDITVKLQQNQRIQVIMLEAIKNSDPKLYGEVRRHIQAIVSSGSQLALPSADVVDAEFQEA